MPGHSTCYGSSTRFLLSLTVLILVSTCVTRSQDSHYWTNAYGTQAQLLGGMVVGSANDLSSVFYNPGALASTTDSSLILSTLSAQWTNLEFAQVGQLPLTGESATSGPSPGIFAIRLPFAWPGSSRIAISYLSRTESKVDLSGRTISGDQMGSVANEVFYLQNLSESWLGVSIATDLSERTNIGVSLFLSPSSQRSRAQFVFQAADTAGGGVTSLAFDDYYYNNFRGLLKAGVSFDYRPLTFGIAVTSPSVNLFNTSGWITSNVSRTLVDSGSVVLATHEDGLNSTIQSPLSIALGAAYVFEATTIYFGLEWFGPVNPYTVMDARQLPALEGSLVQDRSSVVNVGLGAQYRFGPGVAVYGSIRTDNSFLEEGQESLTNFAGYDLTHLTGGISLSSSAVELTLGLSYGWGADEGPAPGGRSLIDIPELAAQQVTLSYARFGFVLGFTLSL